LTSTYLKDQLVRYVVRKALDLPIDDIELQRIVGSTQYPIMRKVVGYITRRLVIEKNQHLRCGLCNKGPFTKRGLYLHLMRVHKEDILKMIDEKYAEYSKKQFFPRGGVSS